MSRGTATLADALVDVVGADHVLTGADDRRHFSHDLGFEPREIADVVARPGTVEELQGVVEAAYGAGLAIVARGGGSSYTAGYTPQRADSVVIDTRRLIAIPEINVEDRYVVAEAGCTWEQVWVALSEHGVRTPFWGTGSGRYATVGGSLSQNALLLGSSRYGTLADSVVGLDVIVKDGKLLRTGAGARAGGSPFTRQFGPDLTGAFISDAGALGVKARASLALVPAPTILQGASFAFDDQPQALAALAEMARLNLACELYGTEPFHHRLASTAGFDFLGDVRWAMHALVEGTDEAVVAGSLNALRAIGARHGREFDGNYAVARRAHPFDGERFKTLGPEGQVCLPTHTIVPHSQGAAISRATEELLRETQAERDRHGILVTRLSIAAGRDLLFECFVYWPDELGSARLEMLEPETVAEFGSVPPDLEARAAALAFRRRLVEVFDSFSAVHMQIGKYYEYASRLDPFALETLGALKRTLDPEGLMNPGALGL